MDMSEKFWLGLWCMIGVVVVSVALTIAAYNAYSTHKFVEGGYHACMLTGNRDWLWCK